MGFVQLLDCTLRDGGFVNSWRFGEKNMQKIVSGVTLAGVDIIELGFIHAQRPFDRACSILPDTSSFDKVFADVAFANTLPVAMIDYGTCPLANIAPRREGVLGGIRVIFKKRAREAALDYCATLQAKGYLVFAQPVSVTDYTEEELFHLFSLLNTLCPAVVSVVDTYGLLQGDDILRYFSLFHEALAPEIGLGFHGHNNLQLAFSNCISFLQAAKTSCCVRSITLDGSLLGMGKSAGNAPLELLATHLNGKEERHYHTEHLLAVIDKVIAPLCGAPAWGYSLPYFLAAAAACHPQYVFCLLHELGVSAADALPLLQSLDNAKRLTFDKAHLLACAKKYGVKEKIFTGGTP